MNTIELIEFLDELLSRATPGKWEAVKPYAPERDARWTVFAGADSVARVTESNYEGRCQADAELIATLVNVYPIIVAELREQLNLNERLRRAHLWHVYEGDSSTGCGICQCRWEPGDAEVHDSDCIARDEEQK
mgnify:CR=1 FL=1